MCLLFLLSLGPDTIELHSLLFVWLIVKSLVDVFSKLWTAAKAILPPDPPPPRIRKSRTWLKILRRRFLPRAKRRSYRNAVIRAFPLRLRRIRFFPDHCPLYSDYERWCRYRDAYDHARAVNSFLDVLRERDGASLAAPSVSDAIPTAPPSYIPRFARTWASSVKKLLFGVGIFCGSVDGVLLSSTKNCVAPCLPVRQSSASAHERRRSVPVGRPVAAPVFSTVQDPAFGQSDCFLSETSSNIPQFNFLTEIDSVGTEIIYDTGASTHVLNDARLFDSPPQPLNKALELKGIAGSLNAECGGVFTCKAIGQDGQWSTFRGFAYYAPQCPRSLISIQMLVQDAERVHLSSSWLAKLRTLGHRPSSVIMADKISFAHLYPHQPSFDVHVDPLSNLFIGMVYPEHFELDSPKDSVEVNVAAVDMANKNLSKHQKTLLEWHQKLGHVHMQAVQNLLRHRDLGTSKTNSTALKQAANCPCFECASCAFGKQTLRQKAGKVSSVVPSTVGATKRNRLLPGDRVFVDHFHCGQHGRLESGTGHGARCYVGGSVWVDAATGIIRVHLQESLDTEDTLLGKHLFEANIFSKLGCVNMASCTFVNTSWTALKVSQVTTLLPISQSPVRFSVSQPPVLTIIMG